ncbi:MAG: hypothetical protein ACE5FG_07680 [Myxococcota bacterium]
MKFPSAAWIALLCLALSGCGLFGRGGPGQCRIDVLGVEDWNHRDGSLDASFRVAGVAGSPAVVWLTARVSPERYIPGKGVPVGPGPFRAIVDLALTGRPQEFMVVLEVADPSRARPVRCRAKAKMPRA